MIRFFKIFMFTMLLAAFCSTKVIAQAVPSDEENIPYLVTFGADSDPSWGDDDFCQIFFCTMPTSFIDPFYIRVFDPDTGGEIDEPKGNFNTQTSFAIFGGNGAYSNPDARLKDPIGNYESGNLIASRKFDDAARFDQEWYLFGPINPKEGEYVEKFDANVFKIVVKGISGDDGNLYRLFMSTEKKVNKPIEGGNVFTFEYTFRLSNNQNNVSQIYPYLDADVTAVKIQNFDWDNDGFIRVVSVAKRGELCSISNENNWRDCTFPITEKEKNTSMEIQFIKNSSRRIENNNVVLIVENQYGISLPFFVVPIGGRPVYNPSLRMKAIEKR